MSKRIKKVLVAKKDAREQNALSRLLAHAGYSIITASTFQEVRTTISDNRDSLYAVLLDLTLPDGDAIRFIPLSGISSFCHVIIHSQFQQNPDVHPGLGMLMGDEYLGMPFILDKMQQRLHDSASVRVATLADIHSIYAIAEQTWKRKEIVEPSQFIKRQTTFPAGQLVATLVLNGVERTIGFIGALIAQSNKIARTWTGFTGNGTYSTHDQNGNVLVCPQIGTDREFLLRMGINGIARKLICAERELANQNGLGLIAYSRFSDFGNRRILVPDQTPLDYYQYCVSTDFREEQNIGMHIHFGGTTRPEWVLPNACPMDLDAGGAIVLVQYSFPWLEKPVTIRLLSEAHPPYQYVPM